jgi:hypothetical protein
MYLSGVGIGMGRRMQEAAIHADRHPGASVLCGAAVGAAMPTPRGAPIALTTTRSVPSTALAFGV